MTEDDNTIERLRRGARFRLIRLTQRANDMDRETLEDLMTPLDEVRDSARVRRAIGGAR
ncbi:hypothetical protein [Cellulosimicrobium cellulans]|uniref:hypothetical protein n=1 Tax=Cellulosimicrobium cellulans TaxID=1710 RepID=UPI0012FD4CDA|nr:hypothetical protein [Cellulosimicrobium cellulans]